MNKDLSIMGFCKNELEKTREDIAKLRAQLNELVAKEQKLSQKEINIDKTKFYKFMDPQDDTIEYCGVIYDFYKSDKYVVINLCGLQKNLTGIIDSCWSGFDSCYQLYVLDHYIDDFVNSLVVLSNEEFKEYCNKFCSETMESLKMWLENVIEDD